MTEPSAEWPRLLPAGDQGVLIEFEDRIDPEVNRSVYDVVTAIEAAGVAGVVELVPSYRSLLVHYDLHAVSFDDMSAALRAILQRQPAAAEPTEMDDEPTFHIPVVYGGEEGPDLATVARHSRLSEAAVVSIHSGGLYRVYMLGFAPGFPYLGGMDPRIACPRLSTPRVRIPAGSVGIAESQTGIYPMDSPGGWQIIGRTPVVLFDARADPPVAIRPGSRVRFDRVSRDEAARISAAIAHGKFRLNPVKGPQ